MDKKMGFNYVAFGARIRTFRAAAGLTQQTLAERVDVSTSFIGHLERGEKKPSLETVVRLCACLNVTLDELALGLANRCNKAQCPLFGELKQLMARYGGP